MSDLSDLSDGFSSALGFALIFFGEGSGSFLNFFGVERFSVKSEGTAAFGEGLAVDGVFSVCQFGKRYYACVTARRG